MRYMLPSVQAKLANNPQVSCIVLGIPSVGRACPLELAISLSSQAYPVNTGLAWSVVCGKPVAEAREEIVVSALECNPKYIWFVDDDTVPPLDAARKLVYVLDQEEANGTNVAVCGGIATTRTDPPEPTVYLGEGRGAHWDWKAGDVFECWAMGANCMMIRASVFRELPRPWFKTTREADKTEGEDIYFCRLLQEHGYRIKAHGGVLCRHWDMKTMTVYQLPQDSFPLTAR